MEKQYDLFIDIEPIKSLAANQRSSRFPLTIDFDKQTSRQAALALNKEAKGKG
ncbi:hypothetical protein ACMFWY_17415 [Roseiconus sp. JC912]|uniref:hypothetical protein n=1 Tax=Roseiconus sp. JC912 TaxID=3396307 RepID=UPI003A4C5855